MVISMYRRNPGVCGIYLVLRPTQKYADCSNGFCVMQRTVGQVLFSPLRYFSVSWMVFNDLRAFRPGQWVESCV